MVQKRFDVSPENMHERVQQIQQELDVDRDYAVELLKLQQNERIIEELSDVEVHTQNLVRTGSKQRKRT